MFFSSFKSENKSGIKNVVFLVVSRIILLLTRLTLFSFQFFHFNFYFG